MIKNNIGNGNCVQTYTGKLVDVFNPDPETINLTDIAHALSNLCRFGGHTQNFYSVAEHSVIVCELVPDKYKVQGLLHDAAEAYLIDLPRPIKRQIKQYSVIEDNLMKVIAERFGLDYPFNDQVKKVDDLLCRAEYDCLMQKQEWLLPSSKIMYWPPTIAEAQMRATMARFDLFKYV